MYSRLGYGQNKKKKKKKKKKERKKEVLFPEIPTTHPFGAFQTF